MAIINVIKYEGKNDTFVFKHEAEDFNSGSQLIVHESQEAVFFRDGKALDRFGAGKYTLDTESLPMMKQFFKKVSEGECQFHAEVYFVNLATIMGVKWGTDTKVRMYDPASGLHLEIGAYGEFNIRVNDSGKILLKLVGTELGLKREDVLGGSGYTNSSVSGKFKALVMTKVKSYLPKAIRENNIDILEVDEYLDQISEYIRNELNKTFESYGLYLPEFYVTCIATPDDDPNYRRLKAQHAERYLKIQEERIKQAEAEARRGRVLVEAETDAEVKIIGVKAEEERVRRMAYAEAENTRAQGLAEADVMRAQGLAHAEALRAQGGNYQAETSRIVGQAAAENESGGGAGMGSAVGGVVQAGIGLGTAIAVGKTTVGVVKDVIDDMMPSNNANNPAPAVSNNTWVCPNCGTTNDGKFCKECGTKKVEDTNWTCPECGSVNDGKFCANCGHKRG